MLLQANQNISSIHSGHRLPETVQPLDGLKRQTLPQGQTRVVVDTVWLVAEPFFYTPLDPE